MALLVLLEHPSAPGFSRRSGESGGVVEASMARRGDRGPGRRGVCGLAFLGNATASHLGSRQRSSFSRGLGGCRWMDHFPGVEHVACCF